VAVKRSFLLRFGDVQKLRRTYVKDISRGGMFVRSRKPQAKGSRVQVVLELPDGSRFPLEGEVVTLRESTDGTGGNGIRFIDLDSGRLAMLESYIDACAAGVPQPILRDDSDISLVNVIEPEVERKLQTAVTKAAGALPTSALNRLGPGLKAPPADFLLRLDRALREVERLSSGNAYEVLGVEPKANFEGVRGVLEHRLAEYVIDPSLGKIPARLTSRVQAVKAKLQMAAHTLLDASARAAMDIEHGRLLPETDEPTVRQEFEHELRRRRDKATPGERQEFALAEPFLELARQKKNADDLKAARSLFRAALLYDPHNLEIREVAAAVRAELKLAHPTPPPQLVRAAITDAEPPPPSVPPPATTSEEGEGPVRSVPPGSAPSESPGLPPPPPSAALTTPEAERPDTERMRAEDGEPETLDIDPDPSGIAEVRAVLEEPESHKSRVGLIAVAGGLAVGAVVGAFVLIGGGGDEAAGADAGAPVVAKADDETGGAVPAEAEAGEPEAADPPPAAAETGDAAPANTDTGHASPESEAEASAGAEPPAEDPPAEPAAADPPAQGSFAEVERLIAAGEHQAAMDLAAQQRGKDDRNTAFRYMTIAACHLKDGALARANFRKLVGKNTRRIAGDACREAGINVFAKVQGATAGELLEQAILVQRQGDAAKACDLARQSNRKKPSAPAMEIVGVCACNDGNVAKAKKLVGLLPNPQRGNLLAKCKEAGVEL
jgi:uncharacterized protein (TIGR02266 family)